MEISGKFPERFTGNFLPLQTFHITVNLLMTFNNVKVSSPEMSCRKFPEIYSYFSGNFRKISGTILQEIFCHYKPSV